MRFDTPIYFQTITPGEYNSSTGDYGKDAVTEEKIYANVTSAGVDTLNLIYGELKQGAYVIRLQRHYNKVFDRVRVENKIYRVDFQRKQKVKHVFVVSEVQ